MLKIFSTTSLVNVISVTYCITISIIGNIFISNIHCSSKHNDGDIKLVDGPSELAGTVLVYRTYGWGKICDDHWTMKEANVVCKQLGMGYALEVYRRNRFGSSSQSKSGFFFLNCLVITVL
ncbi:unnamed protein product [Trichobilharzia regenti]|nr:unnamed protein product [Trichobilharzia regenti]